MPNTKDQGTVFSTTHNTTQNHLTNCQCCGTRPQCQECTTRVTDCRYTETEAAMLRRKHEDLETLFDMLKTLPQQEAEQLLANIRAGGDAGDLVEQVRGGKLLVQLSLAKSGGKEREDRRVSITQLLNA
jgi:hypothetical protein